MYGVVVDGTTALLNQRRFATAVFASRHDVQPRSYEVTWDELAGALLEHRVYSSKHEAWLWSPTLYREGATRGREGIQAVTLLVADIDDGTPPDQLREWLRAAGTAYLWASTWSHTLEAPHLRVVVPLLMPIPATDYGEVWRQFNQHVLRSHIDPSTKDASRLYYAPGCPFDRQHLALTERFDDAPPLDWRRLPPVAEEPRTWTKPLSALSTEPLDELEYRARCFLSKWHADLASMPPETGRHNALRSKAVAAGGLIAAGVLSEQEAYAALMSACETNGLLSDPGGAAERTLRDGFEYGASMPWRPDSLPDSPTWRARVEGPRMGQTEAQKKEFPVPTPLRGELNIDASLTFHTAREIAEQALPEVAWIARPWIAEGGLTEVDGKVKAAGKTTWLLALIRCVLDGEPFMGQPTLRTPVVLLSEQGPRSLQQALLRAGLEDRDDLHLLLWHETRGWKWPDVVEAAAAKCREVGALLLAVDTLSQFVGLHGDSENSSGEALLAMQPLQLVIARDGVGVIFNRHERKGGGDVGESGRGSSAYAGAVDIIISLRRAGMDVRPTVRHLHALSRFDETPQKTVIELQGVRYVALGDEETLTAEHAASAVLGALGGENEALSATELQEQVTIRRQDMFAALNALLASGAVRRIGSGKRGDPYRYFRPDEQEELEL